MTLLQLHPITGNVREVISRIPISNNPVPLEIAQAMQSPLVRSFRSTCPPG